MLKDNEELLVVEVGEHYRLADDARNTDGNPLVPGVYRVVGTLDEVTLLRVTDAEERRTHTGEIHHVAPDTLDISFERANDPDAGLTPVSDVRNLVSGLYWSVRQFF